jgi:hypothetical protein
MTPRHAPTPTTLPLLPLQGILPDTLAISLTPSARLATWSELLPPPAVEPARPYARHASHRRGHGGAAAERARRRDQGRADFWSIVAVGFVGDLALLCAVAGAIILGS